MLIVFICVYFTLQISSVCPVCVTYQARSSFIITSLRPAFAKVFPSTRPDLAVETFFHARTGSPLLEGITDDDFITWFGKPSFKVNTNVDNICECGRICSKGYKKVKHGGSTANTTGLVSHKKQRILPSKSTTSVTATKVSAAILPTETIPDIKSPFNTNSTVIPSTVKVTEGANINNAIKDTKENIIKATETNTGNEHADPIIRPTATYVNHYDSQNIDNHLPPIVFKGELIVQKPKIIVSKKETEIKKKTYPRKKGTLKSTYGNKHEKFFDSVMNTSMTNNTLSLPDPIKLDKALKTTQETIKVIKKIDIKPVYGTENITFHAKSTNNNTELNRQLGTLDISIKTADKVFVKLNSTEDTFIPHTTVAGYTETSTITHPIAAVTYSNIKRFFYRSKKPKYEEQFQSPAAIINSTLIGPKHIEPNEDISKNKSENSVVNNTKIKNASQESYDYKLVKSINKEIHKMPSIPISETSKALSASPKPDIAPENRGGFEISDKNHVWELLKEGKDKDVAKSDDKLQVYKLNIQAQNMSTSNESHSL